jgi:high-affinity nickel-transport protein
VFGGLSVLLYKPWRRRVDRKRVKNAHFEALPQENDTAGLDEEEPREVLASTTTHPKDVDVNVESVETTDVAGPAHR